MNLIYLSVAFAGVGLLFLGQFFNLIRHFDNSLGLDKHRSKEEGVADLLIYSAMVDDGIIVGKNGALMMAWEYTGEDISASSDSQRDSVSSHINRAFANMGSGWMVHIDCVRHLAPNYSVAEVSHFPNALTRAIDDERRRLFEQRGTLYEGKFIITLTWLPPKLAERKFIELMFDDESERTASKTRTMSLIEEFKKECDSFEGRIAAAIQLKRLVADKCVDEHGVSFAYDTFLAHLQHCITGLDHPVILPKNPIYLDSLIGGQELWSGVLPKIGQHYIQVVAIDGFPFEGSPGILNALSELPCSYRWSSRFIFLERHEAIANLESYRKKWKQKVRGFFDQLFNTHGGIVDEDALSMVSESSSAIADINSGLLGQGYYTSVVVLMHESREAVIDLASRVQKAINGLGFTARVESINTMEAFLGSLPGHGVENIRRPLINTLNFADLIPVNTIWSGENKAPCPLYPTNAPPLMHCVTNGNSPFRLNCHIRDLGHTLMFGPTRAGKSTHLGIVALQFLRYANARVFAFDKGMSMYPACMAAGGYHFNIGSDDTNLAFAPLSSLASGESKAWAMEWIDTLLGLNGVATSPAQRNEIARALSNMANNQDSSLSEFIIDVQDQQIKTALKQYSVDGLMGYLLDATEDGLTFANFTVFEIEKLMGMGDKYALPVLLYLFYRIEQSLDGNPTVIFIDEAWLMLGHPVFKEKIREWLKTLAKKNCFVFLATQNLSDAKRSGILDVLVESTAVKIFLANPTARSGDNKEVYLSMGLNEKQIDTIAGAAPKRDYYYVSEKGSRLYNLALGRLALAFVGHTDMDSVNHIKSLVAKYGDQWVNHWLAHLGVHYKTEGSV